MGEEIKFENPTDLLEKVKSHGGKVFETLYYWQSFDRDNNIRILKDVIEYVERNNQKVFEVTGHGLTNIPDSSVPFALPQNVKLNAKSVRWFFETTLEGLKEELAWNRKVKNPYTREDGTRVQIEKEVLPLNKEVFGQLIDKSIKEVIDKFGEDSHTPEKLGELIFDNFLGSLGNSGYKPSGGGWWYTQWDGEKLHITAPDGTHMGAIGPDANTKTKVS